MKFRVIKWVALATALFLTYSMVVPTLAMELSSVVGGEIEQNISQSGEENPREGETEPSSSTGEGLDTQTQEKPKDEPSEDGDEEKSNDSSPSELPTEQEVTLAEDSSGLDGKTFAIVNETTQRALSSTTGTGEQGQRNLAPVSAIVVRDGENAYVSGTNIALWTFHKTESEDWYFISTYVGTKQMYLHMERVSGKNWGSLYLDDTPQAFRVTQETGGYRFLLYTDANGGCYVNASGSSSPYGSFWGYSGTGNNSLQTLCFLSDYGISLDVNTSSLLPSNSEGWLNGSVPTVENAVLTFDTDAQTHVLAKPSGYFEEAGAAGMTGLYRAIVTKPNNLSSFSDLSQEMQDTWFAEYRFDGWECSIDDKVYTFAAGTTLSVRSDGRIWGADVDGNDVNVPYGAQFYGKWTQISSIVTFFVCYSGTILDTEGDVAYRNTSQFTLTAAAGHIFYAQTQVGTDGLFAQAVNEEIRAAFVEEFDPALEQTQIVIDSLRQCTDPGSGNGKDYKSALNIYAPGANPKEIEKAILASIKTSGQTILLSSAQYRTDENGVTTTERYNPPIDNALCDEEHYEIRWYVLKEQNDSWHIDGVLVAKTDEVVVTNTFRGLPDETVQTLVDTSSISVYLGDDAASSNQYVDMTNESLTNQYDYLGEQGDNGVNSAWVLYAIQDEQYQFTENNYEVDGYTCYSIVAAQDTTGDTTQAVGTSTRKLARSVVVGQVSSVSFSNYYTQIDTGAFSLVKVDSEDEDVTLPGATFALLDADGQTVLQTQTTDSQGEAFFSDLDAGTYLLVETQAPSGYVTLQDDAASWTVRVSQVDTLDGDVVTVVTVDDETVFDSDNGGILQGFIIKNTKMNHIVTIRKTFAQMSNETLRALVAGSTPDASNPYSIEVGGVHLYLSASAHSEVNPSVSTDGKTFTWVMELEEKPESIGVTEHNFFVDAYADVSVSASVNGAQVASVTTDRAQNTASFTASLQPTQGDTIELTNSYVDAFSLQLQKVSSDAATPLEGAAFKLYGPRVDSINTSDWLSIQDPISGESKKVYLIATDAQTNENGELVFSKLKLPQNESETTYVLLETAAPEGYVLEESPIVCRISADEMGNVLCDVYFQRDEGNAAASYQYAAGVLSVVIPNAPIKPQTLELVVQVQWSDDESLHKEALVNLYRKTEDAPYAQLVGTALIANDDNDWTVSWSDLDISTGGENPKEYFYYVSETPLEGYRTTYDTEIVQLEQQNSDPIQAAVATERVTVMNTMRVKLPDAGGPGILWFQIGGCICLAAGLWIAAMTKGSKNKKKYIQF